MNKVMMIGRLVNQLELKETESKKKYTFVSIAVDDARSQQQPTDFISFTVWGDKAERLVQTTQKGTMLKVEGRLKQKKVVQDGKNISTLEFVPDVIGAKYDMNSILVSGRVTKDVVLETTPSGKNYTRVDFANGYSIGKDDRKTDFYTVTLWDKLAEAMVGKLKKGSEIAVIGATHKREYTGKDGEKRTVQELFPERFGGFKVLKWAQEKTTEELTGEEMLWDDSDFTPVEAGDLPFDM